MNEPIKKLPIVQFPNQPVDPVARSIAKPDAFMKPGSIGKAGAPTNQTRIRPLNWKRTRGRPRIHPKDKRKIDFF